MTPRREFAKIDNESLNNLLAEYPSLLPAKLLDLDTARYESIPTALASRKAFGDAFLTKADLVTLVEWKLSHGTFRPALKAHINQNSNEIVDITTRDALSAFDASSIESVKKSLNTLTRLKGIGPATASLILSVFEPQKAPFFSDELFRWVLWEDGRGKGWDRSIKYTLKEYIDLFETVQGRVAEEGLKAVDLEKAAYVLGRGAGKTREDASVASKKESTTRAHQNVPLSAKGKRKAEEETAESHRMKSRKNVNGAKLGTERAERNVESSRKRNVATRSSTRSKKS